MMCVHAVDIRECRECQQAKAIIYLYRLQQRPGNITAEEVGVILAQGVKLLKK